MKSGERISALIACMSGLLFGDPLIACFASEAIIGDSEVVTFRVERVAKGLQIPWAMAFLSDGRALVSERAAGRIILLDVKSGEVTILEGGPGDVFIKDNAGMLDVVAHPAFGNNDMIYYCYTVGTP